MHKGNGSYGSRSRNAASKSKTRLTKSYIEVRKALPVNELVIKGKLGNAYQYPHPNAKLMFDPKSPQAILNAERIETPNVNWVFPDVRADDIRYLRFLDLTSKQLTKEFPAHVDPDTGYTYANGVRGNFYGIRHVSGLPMTPATYTLISNASRRKAAGLTNKVTQDWHRNLMLAWWLLAIEGMKPVGLKINTNSSSCVPEFTKDMSRKMEIAREGFRDAKHSGDLMLKGNYADAWTRYQMGGAVYIVYRLQVTDKITYDPKTKIYTPKGRAIADIDFALSGGESGTLQDADKSKYVNDLFTEKGYDMPGFFACRKRTAAGGPWKMNAVLGVISDSMRVNIYEKFPKTYHDRDKHQKTEEVHAFDSVIMADVSDHDLLYGEYNVDIACEAFRIAGFAEWWIAIFKRSLTLPMYVSSLSADDGSTLIGEWDKPNPFSMLLSGNKFTDILGTGGMTPVYTIGQVEHTAPHHIPTIARSVGSAMKWLSSYLKHELDIAQKSKSDDAALLFRTARVVAKAKVLQKKLVHADLKEGEFKNFKYSDYMIVGYEAGGAYLGHLLFFDSTLELKNARFIGNIMSFVMNKFGPEYSCVPRGGTMDDLVRSKRPFPGIAWESVVDVYGDSPILNDVLNVIEDNWALCFGQSFKGYMNLLLKEDRIALEKYSKWQTNLWISDANSAISASTRRTSIDNEVLADRSKIQYKYTLDQVSSQFHHLLVNQIPVEEVVPFFNSIVRPSNDDTFDQKLRA